MWGLSDELEPPMTHHQRHLAKKLARIQAKMGVSPEEFSMSGYGYGDYGADAMSAVARLVGGNANTRPEPGSAEYNAYKKRAAQARQVSVSAGHRPPLPGGQAGLHHPQPGRHAVGFHRPAPRHHLRGIHPHGRHAGRHPGRHHPGLHGKPSEAAVRAAYQAVNVGVFRHKRNIASLSPHHVAVLHAYVAHSAAFGWAFKVAHPPKHAVKWLAMHRAAAGGGAHPMLRRHHAPGPGGAMMTAPGGAFASEGADSDVGSEDVGGRRVGGKGKRAAEGADAEASAEVEASADDAAVEADSGGPSPLLIGGILVAVLAGGYFLFAGKKKSAPASSSPRMNSRRRRACR